MSKRMKRPCPEVAYMLALVAAQKHRVRVVEYDMRIVLDRLEKQLASEQRHLEGLEGNLARVKKNITHAKAAAAVPWLPKK